MQFTSLVDEATYYDNMFTEVMNKIPSFFTTYTRPAMNKKYIFNRDGFSAASYKTNKKIKAVTMNDDEDDDEDDEDDDEDDESDEESMNSGDANALFSKKNQRKLDLRATINEEEEEGVEDVGFGAPKSYADIDTLRHRLQAKMKEGHALPKLSKDQIATRKAKRDTKKQSDKEKGIKQKSAPAGGHVSTKRQLTHDGKVVESSDEIKHENKRTKLSSTKLENPTFAPILQHFVTKSVQTAGRKHISSKPKAKQQLQNLEQFQADVDALRTAGKSQEADKMVKTKSVSVALQRAMGENINDNIISLKKQIKQDQKTKEKSAKVWKSRTNNAEKEKNTRLDARDLHIRKKIEHKRNAKIERKNRK